MPVPAKMDHSTSGQLKFLDGDSSVLNVILEKLLDFDGFLSSLVIFFFLCINSGKLVEHVGKDLLVPVLLGLDFLKTRCDLKQLSRLEGFK
jgi:hypothetical protein